MAGSGDKNKDYVEKPVFTIVFIMSRSILSLCEEKMCHSISHFCWETIKNIHVPFS